MEKSVAESTGGATGGMSYAGAIQGTVKPDSKPIFLKEVDYFGSIKPTKEQWLSNEELYKTLLNHKIPAEAILGIQRVGSLWRLYIENVVNRVALVATGLTVRGVNIPVYELNPFKPDRTGQLRVRFRDIPLSADDSIITKTLQDHGCIVTEPPSREKLRVDGKLTHCETGDRIVYVKPLKDPLPKLMKVGQFRATVTHYGQFLKSQTCGKCLQEGHRFNECENDWVCKSCKEPGHKQSDCPYAEASENPLSIPEPVSGHIELAPTAGDHSAESTLTVGDHGVQKNGSFDHGKDVDEKDADGKRKKKKGKRRTKKDKTKTGDRGNRPIDSFFQAGVRKGDESTPKPSNRPRSRSPPTPIDELIAQKKSKASDVTQTTGTGNGDDIDDGDDEDSDSSSSGTDTQ